MRTPSGDYAKGPCSTCSTAGCKSQEAGLYRLALRGHPYGAGKFQSLPDSVLPSRSSSREDSIGRCFDINEVTLSESAVSLVCLVMPCHSCCKLCPIFFNYHNVNGPSPVLAYRNKCQSCLNLRSDATAAKTKSSKQNANHMSNNPGNHVKKINWTIIMPAAPESFRLLLVCTFSRPTWISFCFALLQQVQLPWQVAQRVVQICLHTPEKNSATVCIQIEIPWMIQTATATQG